MVRGRPPRRAISVSHCGAVDVSHQSFAGRMTRPSASRGTNPCCWPEMPMAATRPAASAPAAASTPATTSVAARTQSAGSCSLVPGTSDGRMP